MCVACRPRSCGVLGPSPRSQHLKSASHVLCQVTSERRLSRAAPTPVKLAHSYYIGPVIAVPLQHGLPSIAEQSAFTPKPRLQHHHSSHFMQTCFGRWTRSLEAAARQVSRGGTDTASAQSSSDRGSSRTHICTQADGRAEAK
jgi:hypothetical protein